MTEEKKDEGRLDEVRPGRVEGVASVPESSEEAVVAEAGKAPESRFKLELLYDGNFSVHKKNLGVLYIWGTGGNEMPNADWKIYMCPRDKCEGLVTPSSHGHIAAVCPMCKTAWYPNQLHGEMAWVVDVNDWVTIVCKYLRRLGMDADLYLKRFKTNLSIIEADKQERDRPMGGELLNKAREVEAVIYTRDSILKDTQVGTTPLESAIKAFLLA